MRIDLPGNRINRSLRVRMTDGRTLRGTPRSEKEFGRGDAWFTTDTSEQEFLNWLHGSYSLI